MRLQSLSEPRSSFPSRGFHRPTPEHPDEAFFIFPPARPPKWMAGNSPHKVAANNLAKLATSPPPPSPPPRDWKPPYAGYPWMIYLEPDKQNGLTKKSGADTFQVRSVDHARLVKKLGQLSEPVMEEIAAGIVICIEYR